MKTEQVKLRNEMTKLQKQLEESQQKINELTSNVIADLTKEDLTADERARIDQLLQENQKANTDLFDAQEEIEKLQKEMEEYRRQLDESDSEQRDMKELSKMVDLLEDEVERLKEDNRSLHDEIESRDADMKKKDVELQEANQQIRQLEDTLEAMKEGDEGEGEEGMQAQIARLTAQLKKSESETLEARMKAEKASRDLQELLGGGSDESISPRKTQQLDNEIKSLKSKNSKLESELQRWKSEAIDESAELLRLKVGELEKSLRVKDREMARLQSKIANESYNDQETIANFQQQLNDEAELKEDARHKADELIKKNRALTKEVNQLKKDIRQRNAEAKNISEKSAKSDVDQLRAQLKAAQNELESTQRDQNNLQLLYEKLSDDRDNALAALREAKQEFDISKNVFKRKMATAAEQLATVKKQAGDSALIKKMESILEGRETQHRSELHALALQIRYLRSKSEHDQMIRSNCAFIKKFFLKQIESFEAW